MPTHYFKANSWLVLLCITLDPLSYLVLCFGIVIANDFEVVDIT